MFKKTITTEFFSTLNYLIFLRSLCYLTIKLPLIRYGKNPKKIEKKLLKFLGIKQSGIISLYNGRSAIFHALKIIGIEKNDEIIVSGYTCVSVSNAVIQTGAKIIYSDINKNDLGFDIKKLEKNINKKTKVIIIQHTFGKPSNIEEIIKIANENNIVVIEDCAHSLGSSINGKMLGTFGDLAIFSIGRDKVVSGVTGGFLVINNKNYFNKAEIINKKLKMPSIFLVIKNLNYNIFGYISYLTYDFFKIGKLIIYLSRKLGLITEILSQKEKECKFKEFNYKLPNSMAFLGLNEFKNLELLTRHRRSIGEYYENKINNKLIKILFANKKSEELNYFRFPIILNDEKIAKDLYFYMRKHKIILGNSWSQINIAPIGSNLKNAQYNLGTCKTAEDISKRILILPNHGLVKPKDVQRVTKILNNFKYGNV